MFIVLVLAMWCAALFVPLVAYYLWMKRKSIMTWNLNLDKNYRPTVTLIVATYNEAVVIDRKLQNIQTLDYPRDKLQVIVVDSASSDNTLGQCKHFLAENTTRFPIQLISENERLGKSHALNTALRYAKGEIIATSDADSFWEPEALKEAVSFFADSAVGAVSGREELSNLNKSIHTQSEGLYRQFYYTLRLGESKVHSTFIFQGELALYRRSTLEKFEDRPGYSDDIGTVVNIVSRGYRCIFVPTAVFNDMAAHSLEGRISVKSRRAEHLIAGIIQSLRARVRHEIPVSSAIVLFNFYMHVLSPLILLAALYEIIVLFVFEPLVALFIIPVIFAMFCLKKTRLAAVSYLTSNLALLVGLFHHFFGKRQLAWHKINEMREG